jgi:hypothetical protein
MAEKFYYDSITVMPPRPGKKYSTTYYHQDRLERQKMSRFFQKNIQQLFDVLNRNKSEMKWAEYTPLKGFPQSAGKGNRTLLQLLIDTMGECQGIKKNGDPKDFAQAPIERWNRLMKDTPWEIEMISGDRPNNHYNHLFK